MMWKYLTHKVVRLIVVLLLGYSINGLQAQSNEYEYDDQVEEEDDYWEQENQAQYYPMPEEELENYYQENLTSNDFDAKKWDKLTEGYDFSVEVRRRDVEGSKISFGPLLLGFLKILAILVIVGVVALILYNLLGISIAPKNKQIQKNSLGPVTLENIEDRLEDTDLKDFIQKALTEGNYKLAIRLYYLSVLQSLSLGKNIKWSKDKTNKDYLRELKDSPFKAAFRNVTSIFERAWYGDRSISKDEFDDVAPEFKDLVKDIDNQKPN